MWGCVAMRRQGVGELLADYKMADILTVNRGHFHSYSRPGAGNENIDLTNLANILQYIFQGVWLEPLRCDLMKIQ